MFDRRTVISIYIYLICILCLFPYYLLTKYFYFVYQENRLHRNSSTLGKGKESEGGRQNLVENQKENNKNPITYLKVQIPIYFSYKYRGLLFFFSYSCILRHLKFNSFNFNCCFPILPATCTFPVLFYLIRAIIYLFILKSGDLFSTFNFDTSFFFLLLEYFRAQKQEYSNEFDLNINYSLTSAPLLWQINKWFYNLYTHNCLGYTSFTVGNSLHKTGVSQGRQYHNQVSVSG